MQTRRAAVRHGRLPRLDACLTAGSLLRAAVKGRPLTDSPACSQGRPGDGLGRQAQPTQTRQPDTPPLGVLEIRNWRSCAIKHASRAQGQRDAVTRGEDRNGALAAVAAIGTRQTRAGPYTYLFMALRQTRAAGVWRKREWRRILTLRVAGLQQPQRRPAGRGASSTRGGPAVGAERAASWRRIREPPQSAARMGYEGRRGARMGSERRRARAGRCFLSLSAPPPSIPYRPPLPGP